MKLNQILFSFLIISAILARAPGAEEPLLDPHLEPLRPLLEKTWRGEFKGSTPDKPVVDVARWERALNGQAVRVLHSINDGIYGGEILLYWDKKREQISYNYFTTAGFTSTGELRIKEGKLHTHEVISNNSDGITEVRAVSEIGTDGTLHVKSEHLKNGSWVPGHEVTYRPESTAKVIFR